MTYAEDRRVLVISWLLTGMSRRDAAHLAGIGTATAQRWLNVYRDTGFFWPDPDLGQRHHDNIRFNPNFLLAVTALIQDRPEAFLCEISQTLREMADLPGWEGMPTSPSTVSRVLRAVGYTHKGVVTCFRERDAARRRAFAEAMRMVPVRCVVSADEVHKDGFTSFRQYGYAQRGRRVESLIASPRHRPRFSAMAAVSVHGVVDTLVCSTPPGFSAVDWALFVRILAPSMGTWNPLLPRHLWHAQQESRSVLLIDNASIHSPAADDLARQYGILVVRVPPYSPDFAPIEGVFSNFKSWLQAESASDRLAGVRMPNGQALGSNQLLMVELGFACITGEQCAAQFGRVYGEYLRHDGAIFEDQADQVHAEWPGDGDGDHDEDVEVDW